MTCPTEVGLIKGMRKLSGIHENYREIRWIGLSKRFSGAILQMWLELADLQYGTTLMRRIRDPQQNWLFDPFEGGLTIFSKSIPISLLRF